MSFLASLGLRWWLLGPLEALLRSLGGSLGLSGRSFGHLTGSLGVSLVLLGPSQVKKAIKMRGEHIFLRILPILSLLRNFISYIIHYI